MELREYMSGDEEEILNLFHLAFKKPLSKAFWEWRFKYNPFLKNPMINLMWDGNTMAGHYAVSASQIMYKGQSFLSSLSGTTMTHPNYEGKGIFTKLALSLYDRIAQDYGIVSVLGFPNQFSHYGLVKKIGWTDVEIVPVFRIQADLLTSSCNSAEINTIQEFNESHATFIQNCIADLGFEVYTDRSAKYLNWRYLQCPINKYHCIEYKQYGEIKGIIIGKEYEIDGRHEIDVVDFFCNEDLNTLSLLFSSIKVFIEENHRVIPQYVNTWLSLRDRRHLEMERLGFRIAPPLTYLCAKPFSIGIDDIKMANKWYIAMGDSDVY